MDGAWSGLEGIGRDWKGVELTGGGAGGAWKGLEGKVTGEERGAEGSGVEGRRLEGRRLAGIPMEETGTEVKS